jgi:steroid Delta-isomerase
MADAETIRARIETYMATFTAGDREGWLDHFADDAWIEDPVGTPRRHGRDAIGGFWDESHEVPDAIELRPAPHAILHVAGNEAAFTMQARPTLGEQVFELDVIDVMTFDEEGRITTMKAFMDQSQLRPASG